MTDSSTMNRLIRQAASRRDVRPDDPDRHEGSIGIGRGAGSAPPPVPSRSEQISASIRDAAGYVRERVTFDDLDGR
jgi:hypothetical protein